MNAHKLYSALQGVERATSHLRRVWQEQDGGFAKTLSTKQQAAEVTHAIALLKVSAVAAEEALATVTPESAPEPPPQP